MMTISNGFAFARRTGHVLFVGIATVLLAACAHPISIEPKNVPERGTDLSPKKVAYVMSSADRQKQYISEGGGGDRVTYYPYRDFERGLRAALFSVYADVTAVASSSDKAALRDANAAYIFIPEITTSSSSPSALTWPPTNFGFYLSVDVLDAGTLPIAKLRVSGNGTAEWGEFKHDFGLAGRRAVEDAARALVDEIRRNERLR
ncbi:hypothetical protein ACLBKS_01655 [Hylemonella sp. W303a]|uniref:hypothetical protein n=1 Tax=Hylemonella sp. W303a TaxID=3389873 RepID=UPI00396AFF75